MPVPGDKALYLASKKFSKGKALSTLRSKLQIILVAIFAWLAFTFKITDIICYVVYYMFLFILSLVILLVLNLGVAFWLHYPKPGGGSRNVKASVDYSRFYPAIFTERTIWDKKIKAKTEAEIDSCTKAKRVLLPDYPQSSSILQNLIERINQDFVKSWFAALSSDTAFTQSTENILSTICVELRRRAGLIDFVQLLTKRIIPILTAHLRAFRYAEQSLRGHRLERELTESDELDLLLATKYCDGWLHPALQISATNNSTFTSETSYLRHLVQKLVPLILPANEQQSKYVQILAREITACSVLFPLINMIADPDYWNQIINSYVSRIGI